MQVSVETLDGLLRRMTVELSVEKVNEIVDNKLRSIAREVRLDGFRPGKVPMKVVKQRYGAHARQEAYGDLIQSSFYEAAVEEKLNPAGEPKIEVKDDGDAFSYTAEFEVVPSVELNDLSGATIERPSSQLADSDVDDMIDKLRKQRVTWNKVERAAQDGDQVTVSFVGTVDGEEFEGGSADNVPIELGSGRMIEGFETGIIGSASGDNVSIEVTFPDDYQAAHLAGKPATFAITVNEVAEPVLPEVNEDLAKALGVEDGSVETMRSDISNNMQRELDQRLKSMTKEKVMDVLIAQHDFQIPQVMIDTEATRLREETKQQMQGQQQGAFELPLDVFKEQGERRVKLGMLVAKIVETQNIEVNDELVRETVESFSSTYDSPQEVIDWYYAEPERLDPVKNVVLEDQVVDWVISQVTVEDKPMNFADLA